MIKARHLLTLQKTLLLTATAKNRATKRGRKSLIKNVKKVSLSASFTVIMLINLALKTLFCLVIKQKKAKVIALAFSIKSIVKSV